MEKYGKRQTYEFCTIRNTMVRLEMIHITETMPDYVHAQSDLLPVSCNRQSDCKHEGIRCIVFDQQGRDPMER
ncbi:MAG: hypothetical protein ABFD54_08855 [Armatimonadota bacterium]|nr:hypothetical protein [bacterium]